MKRLSKSRNDAQLWMCLVVEVKSNAVKNNIAQEHGMLDPWIKVNWNVVKLEMTGVNMDILGISELKCTGTDKFNSDGHYVYYWGQESLRRNGVALTVNKRVLNAVLGCNVKNHRMISVHFQENHSLSQESKSVPQPLIANKLKLDGPMKTYKTF